MKRSKKVAKKRTRKAIAVQPAVIVTGPLPAPVAAVGPAVGQINADTGKVNEAPKKSDAPQTEAGKARSVGIQDYIKAGRPKPHDFEMVYGPRGIRMTWVQRAAAGVDAAHFQAALAECQAAKKMWAELHPVAAEPEKKTVGSEGEVRATAVARTV